MSNQKRRLPLTALRTFEAAARRLSFKDAADELCVSSTTVSNQIRQLERDWKIQLFVRKTRAVILTDVGRSLALTISRSFADIYTEIEAHVSTPGKSVSLAVGPIFGARWLVPRLEKLRTSNPKIQLTVRHGPRITSIDTMPTSVAVDWGDGHWPGLDTKFLLNIAYSPIVSPSLLDRFGSLSTPTDLAHFPIIHQQDRGEWHEWLRLAGAPNVKLQNEITLTDSNMVVQAVLNGQGVALGIFPFMNSEVDCGSIVRPFETKLHPKRSYHLLTRPNARETSEIKTLCEWIESEILGS